MTGRYSRQLAVPGIGTNGQQRLMNSCVLVVGTGGLGTPVLTYLAAAGVGHLTFLDHDAIDLSNLNRQVLFSPSDIGLRKTDRIEKQLSCFNPDLNIHAIDASLTPDLAESLCHSVNLVLDCTDNDPTRRIISRAAHGAGIPMIHGAIAGFEATLAVFRSQISACYGCAYPEPILTESKIPVLGAVAGAVGSMMAVEAVRLLLDIGVDHSSSMLMIDFERGSFDRIRLEKVPNCDVCG